MPINFAGRYGEMDGPFGGRAGQRFTRAFLLTGLDLPDWAPQVISRRLPRLAWLLGKMRLSQYRKTG